MFQQKLRQDLERSSLLLKIMEELPLTIVSSSLLTIKFNSNFGQTQENPVKKRPMKKQFLKIIFFRSSPKLAVFNLDK
jgi:hypothetical protein